MNTLYKKQSVYTLRHYCIICRSKKKFEHLGSHVWQKHQLTANQYREIVGLNKSEPLTSDRVKEIHQFYAKRDEDIIRKTIVDVGTAHRIKTGQKIVGRYKSKQRIEQLKSIHTKRKEVLKQCKECKVFKRMMRWRVYCQDCLPQIKRDRQKKPEVRSYHREWYKKQSKLKSFLVYRAKSHQEWAKRNREHLREYGKAMRYSKGYTCKDGCGRKVNNNTKNFLCIHCFNVRKIGKPRGYETNRSS